jgi:hypothetical protein
MNRRGQFIPHLIVNDGWPLKFMRNCLTETATEIVGHFARQRALAEGSRNPQEIETAFVQ